MEAECHLQTPRRVEQLFAGNTPIVNICVEYRVIHGARKDTKLAPNVSGLASQPA